MGGVNAADLDGVTIDAHGTLVRLVDPVAERGIARDQSVVVHGFRTEVAHYTKHSAAGHDEPGLAELQRDCARVFLEAVGAELDPGEFTPAYASAMHFEPLPGVAPALQRLRSLGLELAVVGNWDLTLHRMLDEVGLAEHFTVVVHAAGKPAPDGLLRALDALGVTSSRALHIGDDAVDEAAARGAGMRFAAAPLPDAVAGLT